MKKILRFISSLHLTVIGLLVLALLTIWGTIYQVDHGLYDAQERIFNSWIFLIGGFLPIPGVKSVIVILAVNLIAAGSVRLSRSWKAIGLWLIHVGIALLLASAGFSYYTSREMTLTLAEGKQANVAYVYPRQEGLDSAATMRLTTHVNLPITIHLLTFTKTDYAGTSNARSYESRIHVCGDDIDRDVVISMNRPFRYRDFAFYQSSYSQNAAGQLSTFAIVRNPAKYLPYVASVIIAVGLMLHFLLRLLLPGTRR